MTRFIFKMVWREARGSLRHFLSFLLSIALGVGSIVAVGNIAANLEEMTFHEARNLLTADLEARLIRPLSPEGEAALGDLERRGIRQVRITEMIGMAATPNLSREGPFQGGYQSQLVELKAVEPWYPFYGRFSVDPPSSDPFRDPEAVWVQEALLIRLGLKVGDRLQLGEADFTIQGIIRKEPDRAVGTFTLGPRVMLSQEGLARTKLVQTGSRLTRRILFQTPEPETPDALKAELKERWAQESVRLQTYREAQPRLGRFLENFTTYLGLVGLITLMIGGIAVASNIHAFLTERLGTIAILKSLGSPATSILLIYLFLAVFLGGIGSLLGVALGVGMYQSLIGLLARFLPPGFAFELTFLPIFRGIAMGVGTTLLFSLWPLQKVWRVAPSRVFRQEVEDSFGEPPTQAEGEKGKRFFSFFASRSFALGLFIALGLSGLSIWQAGSWRLGSWVIGGVTAAVILLLGATRGMLQLIRSLGRPRSLIFRYGIGNLIRPGRQIVTVVLSIGIGVLILLTLLQVEKNLLANLQQNIPEDAPSLFFLDLQPDQKEAFQTIMAKWDLKKPVELTPLVRSRLFDLDGKKVSEIQTEERPDGWYFTREYVLTYQRDLPKHNTIRKGDWWEDGNPNGAVARISAEAEAARHLGIGIGSKVTFDIQGVPIQGEVTSIRDVDWGSLSTNFFFIFEPGALDGAPITYVATATTTPAEDLPIQNAVIRAFPNVTVIHLREILETIAGILKEITRTVRFMALFGFAVGLIVLSGAIAATRARRLHEMTLFKTLGATRPTLLAIMAVEYFLLGLLAAAVGGLLSIGLSWGIVHFFLDLPWRFEGLSLLQGLIVTLLLTLLTGFLMTYRILGQKPLAILRAE